MIYGKNSDFIGKVCSLSTLFLVELQYITIYM